MPILIPLVARFTGRKYAKSVNYTESYTSLGFGDVMILFSDEYLAISIQDFYGLDAGKVAAATNP